MALLALASAALPGRVIAATVDHGLRPDAATEAAMVAHYCGDPGIGAPPIPHAVLSPAEPIGTANLQASARTARYGLLIDWARGKGATILATGHHADDQAETFLMRAARGAGLAGLAAIRRSRRVADDLILLRPLLTWRRRELRTLAEAWGLPFVDDPSNASDRYDRTRFRGLLLQNEWLDVAQIARAASHLADADRDLHQLDRWLIETYGVAAAPGERRITAKGLPREVRRRLVRALVTSLRAELSIENPPWSQASNVESLLDALEVGKSATQAGIMGSETGGIWHFRAAPPRRAI
ncbi:tRNA lysidine(34) synthetase TilS [Sphingomonas aliaeris]|uniref:tRNA(Ile)-lysidine synthase n=2 Tax=Sphingomonas aliaeris TaxID=2759526 RepID=A0A974S5Y7_9SPHN|nr:tRNA lysidine(34) synthetase TilS [Sphingomonas aliaeris]